MLHARHCFDRLALTLPPRPATHLTFIHSYNARSAPCLLNLPPAKHCGNFILAKVWQHWLEELCCETGCYTRCCVMPSIATVHYWQFGRKSWKAHKELLTRFASLFHPDSQIEIKRGLNDVYISICICSCVREFVVLFCSFYVYCRQKSNPSYDFIVLKSRDGSE